MKKTFRACLESLETIDEFILQVISDAGMESRAAYAVRLAVDEACANIIEHAYENKGGEIECLVKDSASALTITLKDWGKPFDPAQIPEPNVKATLEERSQGGLGLYFILKMMDEVKFEFPPQGPNQLTLTKRKAK